jgi:hypothetical protein
MGSSGVTSLLGGVALESSVCQSVMVHHCGEEGEV